MFRNGFLLASRLLSPPALCRTKHLLQHVNWPPLVTLISPRNFSSVLNQSTAQGSLFAKPVLPLTTNEITRNVIKWSLRKGKRKSVRTVLKRFYRLRWGGWIRTKCGRNKKLWKKTTNRKRRLRQHVFCNSTQSTLLDKMVGKYWRKPKYYVDDPYEPYHSREEFPLTAMKPRPYIPPEERY